MHLLTASITSARRLLQPRFKDDSICLLYQVGSIDFGVAERSRWTHVAKRSVVPARLGIETERASGLSRLHLFIRPVYFIPVMFMCIRKTR